MKRPHVIATVLATAAALVLVGTTAQGQTPNASVSVSPSVVGPGGTVHISGSVPVNACPASDPATLTGASALFPPDGFGPKVQRDAQGNFADDYTLPASTPGGRYEVGIRCGGGNVGVSALLRVAKPSSAPEPRGSGTSWGWVVLWAAVGVALLIAGTVFMLRRTLARRGS